MVERCHRTASGTIHYWVSGKRVGTCPHVPTLVFLPGLTADHRLFEKQTAYFEGRYPLLVWDAPGHAASWPFRLNFTLWDKAGWLDEILQKEGFSRPVIIGQSMGGYVGQTYAERFPGKMQGFVSIDSAPLQRRYTTGLEIWLLKRMEPVYRYFPWKPLLKWGSEGVSTTAYGRRLMREMMEVYSSDQKRYAALSGHGFRMLAQAYEADLPYRLGCPALLICGGRDHAGSCIRYNRAWHKSTGLRLVWLENAGHNANTDDPERVNALIEAFVQSLKGGETPPLQGGSPDKEQG